MNLTELGKEFFSFVDANSDKDLAWLALTEREKPHAFHLPFALLQIECRNRTAKKLPNILAVRRFIFPDRDSSEMATHEMVARYHAELVGSGKRVIDLTSGLGIDAISICENGNHVTAIEIDADRAGALAYNSNVIGLEEFNVVNADCLDYMSDKKKHAFDVAFIDPARRDKNQRTFLFKDCMPDIVSNYDLISRAAPTIYVKSSPLVDVHSAVRELADVDEVQVICYNGECKEVLIKLVPGHNKDNEVMITAVNIAPNTELTLQSRIRFPLTALQPKGNVCVPKDIPNLLGYLYDPDAGMRKLRAANPLLEKFPDLQLIGHNSILFYSEALLPDFSGRVFRIKSVLQKRELKQLKGKPYEIVVRDYPASVAELKKRLHTAPGNGLDFLFATTTGSKGNKVLIECQRV